MSWVLLALLVLSLALNVFLARKTIQFGRIILVVEDELSSSLEALEDVEESLDGFLSLKLFFDNTELQELVTNARRNVDLARVAVTRMIMRFVEFSKEKFTIEVEKDDEEPLSARKVRTHINQVRARQQVKDQVQSYIDGFGQ